MDSTQNYLEISGYFSVLLDWLFCDMCDFLVSVFWMFLVPNNNATLFIWPLLHAHEHAHKHLYPNIPNLFWVAFVLCTNFVLHKQVHVFNIQYFGICFYTVCLRIASHCFAGDGLSPKYGASFAATELSIITILEMRLQVHDCDWSL